MPRAVRFPRAVSGLVYEAVEEEMIVYEPRSRHAHALTLSAAGVLLLCDGHHSRETIIGEVSRTMRVPAPEAALQVDHILGDFIARRLLPPRPSRR